MCRMKTAASRIASTAWMFQSKDSVELDLAPQPMSEDLGLSFIWEEEGGF